MGVKYKKDYDLIIGELMEGIKYIERFYMFFGMNDLDWKKLGDGEQKDCLKTMSNDIFYGLGGESIMEVGRGTVSYEQEQGRIKVYDGQKCVHVISLL